MCGIAGFLDLSIGQPFAQKCLLTMLSLLRHRGPDDEGAYFGVENGFYMGMRRLSIIDLQGGHQPIWNEDNTVGIVFNGEIYNYVELAVELVKLGHCFRTKTDTEVIIHLYETYGEGMFRFLRGMFAFAIFDKRKQKLIIARDHFGQKPLYYFKGNGRFAFASEIKALFVLPFVPRDINDNAFLDYISWFSLPAPETHFKSIFKLAPGNFLIVDLNNPNESKQHAFWKYSINKPADLTKISDAAEALDEIMRDSIGIHLRSDVPLGVLLSSGLDSRFISAYIQEFTEGQLSTFSVGFEDGESELEGALETAKELKTKHHSLTISAKQFFDGIETVAWHLDEPVGDPAAFAVFKVCELARNYVKVLLSGEGSDELFAGYEGRYLGIMNTIRRSNRFRLLSWLIPRTKYAFPSSRLGRLSRRAHISEGEEIINLRIEGFYGDVRHPLGLTEEQLKRLYTRQNELASKLFRPQRDLLSEIIVIDTSWQLPESLLLKADKMSMAASIELRTPFLDIKVAEVASRIDSDLKLCSGGPGKLVVRECLRKLLNEKSSRPKKGFPVPLDNWFRRELRDSLEQTIFNEGSICLSRLDSNLLRESWDDFQDGKANLACVFYALFLYETWYRKILSVEAVK